MSTATPTPAPLTATDFASDQDVRWCPGCGDYSILAQMKKVLPQMGVPREQIVFISGIGCSSRFPYYMNTYGMHSIHGRAMAFATGLKSVRQDLQVWVITGDGDARSIDVNVKHLGETLKRAAEHKGTAFVEVYQNCNVFNDGAWDYATDKTTKFDTVIELEHGKPLIFGKNKDKGIRLNGTEPEIVELGKGVTEDDLLFHDEKAPEPTLAYLLSRMRHPEFPEPIGVFRDVDGPKYDVELNRQITAAREKKGEGDLNALYNSGETWTVG